MNPRLHNCQRCGEPFERATDETWKVLCLPCWRASKQPKQKSPPIDDLMRELEQWKTRAHLAELKLQLSTGQGTPVVQFDRDELKTLRRLVHPDRHGNSEAANRITQKINAMLNCKP